MFSFGRFSLLCRFIEIVIPINSRYYMRYIQVVSIIYLLLICWGGKLYAQQVGYSLTALADTLPDTLFSDYPRLAVDSSNAVELLDKWVRSKRESGWCFFSIDELNFSKDSISFRYYTGDRCQFFRPVFEDTVVLFLQHKGADKLLADRPYSGSILSALMDSVSAVYEDGGYPFPMVALQHIEFEKDTMIVHISLESQGQYTVKRLVNDGDARVSEVFLRRYVGLRKGRLYSRTWIAKEIPRLLNQLPYVQQRKEPVVLFDSAQAEVHVFLQKRSSSRFDFILGALPGHRETGGWVITGSALLDLQNTFGRGERAVLMFQRLRPETQEIKASIEYPYPLDLPFGMDGAFQLYSRDTAYRDLGFQVGWSYRMAGNNYLRAFWHTFQTDLLNPNLDQIRMLKRLPAALDVRSQLFGIEGHWERLDDRLNPRKGLRWRATAAAGRREIPVNASIQKLRDPDNPYFSFTSLYDSLNRQSSQWKFQADISYFVPLAARSTIHLGYKGGWLINDASLFRNELFRIGGNRLLRGFDEESIFTSFYHVFTGEYRFLTGPYSHLFAFADVGWLDNQTGEISLRDTPIGFGIGLTFDTPLGLFGLTLAQGRQQGNPWDFRATKLHFGYVSMF
jgi:outer membrane protein assembly factor BamA